MKKLLPILLVIMSCAPQSKVLMTIDDRDITDNEFKRIYNKNSSITIEDKKSVEEYLDLFINYKLKVIEAENLGYDTIPDFVKEMEGYKFQLAKPYLDKNSTLDSFVNEAYDHYVTEVNASHILLRINQNALPKDTVRIYNRLTSIRDTILATVATNGISIKEAWDKAIDDNSRDPENKIGGDLGWFGGFRMVYPFEAAAYNTPVGGISMPVRTMFGYHLILVNDKRPNRGECNARHIMTIAPPEASDLAVDAARKKIERAYDALMNGADWDSIAKEYSEHKTTYFNGGKLGWIKSGTAPDNLLDTCFSIETGEISEIFRSQYGFHIVRVDERKGVLPFEEVKADYTKKVGQMGDIVDITKEQRIKRIQHQYGYAWHEENLAKLYDLLDSTIYTGEWDPEVAKDFNDPLFHIGDSVYTLYDAARKIGERRLAYRGISMEMAIRNRALIYMEDQVVAYELSHLPEKYPEYGYLLQEYHDGILLFNLTEDQVWRKAVEDSAGLVDFYNSMPEKYTWEDRIAIAKYTYSDTTLTDKVLEVAIRRADNELSQAELVRQICGDSVDPPCISVSDLKYEKGDNALADEMVWMKGEYKVSAEKGKQVLYYVQEIIPSRQKTLEDARGLYTADYQTYLEGKWVEGLREKYAIVVNEKVLKKIIREESKK